MLSYIIGLIEEFERNHGRRPQLICLTARHMHQLMEECPDLFEKDRGLPLGFRVLILPEMELSHPKAVWLPPRDRTAQGARPEKEPVLVSWTTRRKIQTKG